MGDILIFIHVTELKLCIARPKWGKSQRQVRNPGVSATRNKGLEQGEAPRAHPPLSAVSGSGE